MVELWPIVGKMTKTAWAGLAASALVFALLAATLTHEPFAESDAQLYASIALTWAHYQVGVPSVMRYSPHAVDHVRFYGPVYFQAVASTFKLLGVSKLAARAVSLGGAVLIAASTAGLALSLGATGAWPWAMLLVLLTPELRYSATDGTMETLAVGLALFGLFLFVRALTSRSRSYVFAAAAGLSLGLSGLTTPRIYPFLVSFGLAGLVYLRRDRRELAHWLIALSGVTALMLGWVWCYDGGLVSWAHLVARVFTHEGSDVALVGTRVWMFRWSRLVVPACAAAGALVAAWALGRTGAERDQRYAAGFALSAAAINFVLVAAGMNLTFMFGIYFAIPLFVILVSLPWPRIGVPLRACRMVTAGLVATLVAFAGLTYLRVALTWKGEDQARVERFLRAHVPAGAALIGPRTMYFFAAQQAGLRYWTANSRSFADWTRWIDKDPDALDDARSLPVRPRPAQRFILWPDDVLPKGYGCAANHKIATYHAPAVPEWSVRESLVHSPRQYPDAVLYALPPGCPTGYDPTDPGNLGS